jgi:hypothetical protein
MSLYEDDVLKELLEPPLMADDGCEVSTTTRRINF